MAEKYVQKKDEEEKIKKKEEEDRKREEEEQKKIKLEASNHKEYKENDKKDVVGASKPKPNPRC